MPRAKKVDNLTPVKKTTRKRVVRKSTPRAKKVAPTNNTQPTFIAPEIFTLTPSITHGHTSYEINSHHVIPKRRPHRKLVITFGVSVIMVIIMGAWIFSLKHSISVRLNQAKVVSDKPTDFENLKKELDSSLAEVKGQLNKLEDTTEIPTAVASPDVNEDVKNTFKAIAGQKITMPITPTAEPAILPN